MKVELWGPYATKGAIDCAGKPYATETFTAEGDGEYETKQVTLESAGYYTYREAIEETDAYDAVETECGEAAETSLAEANPRITTVVSDEVVIPRAAIRDRVRVTGLGETAADVEVELYGPFESRAAISCGGKPYATSRLEVDGDGTVPVQAERIREVGFYTYRERIEKAPGIRAFQTECAEVAETSLGRPEILTGRGDAVRTVRAAAKGDAVPDRVRLDRLGIDAPVLPIGIDMRAGALGISKDIGKVGWWRDGAAPGDGKGATLLAGHVDSAARGAGAFYPLKNARRRRHDRGRPARRRRASLPRHLGEGDAEGQAAGRRLLAAGSRAARPGHLRRPVPLRPGPLPRQHHRHRRPA